MLTHFAEEIWFVDGPEIIADGGFRYPTRMTIIRLEDQSLFICSPIKITPALRKATNALGDVRYLIAPNSLHHRYLQEWQDAYPMAKIFAAPDLMAKRKDIVFDGVLGNQPSPDWADQIDQVVVRGNLITKEVVFFHHKSSTVIFTDLLQQMPQDWYRGWRKVFARLDLKMGGKVRVPRKFRFAFTDHVAANKSLDKIDIWPCKKVLMAHGTPIEEDGRAFIRCAFEWMQ